MTDTITRTDDEILEALDMPTPCSAKEHARGEYGCVPEDPGHWICLLKHSAQHPPPGQLCPTTTAVFCDGYLEYLNQSVARIERDPSRHVYCAGCGLCRHADPAGLASWVTVIGEV